MHLSAAAVFLRSLFSMCHARLTFVEIIPFDNARRIAAVFDVILNVHSGNVDISFVFIIGRALYTRGMCYEEETPRHGPAFEIRV